ncbi:MAG: Nif3-like dinuclear metal center hexameric protein, partial [Planctomycetota bacterium]
FAVTGAGTFFGGDETQPAVGEKGRLETVDEHRLEMVCGRSALPLAVETLRNFHPYEEPPIDVYDLRPAPERALGVGRRLVLDQPATLAELGQRLRVGLGHSRIKLAPPDAAERTVTHIGVVPGAGEDLYAIARDEGCEVFVTGEMRHHSVLAALHDDLCVLLAGHTNTERGYLPHLGARLHKAMPEVAFQVSQRDADPLRVV